MRPSALMAFLVGSFVTHGVAYAALSSLPLEPSAAPREVEVEFTVVASPPAPEPVVVPEPPPRVEPAPRIVERRVAPKPIVPVAPQQPAQAPQVVDAGPAPLTLGVTSESGLAVAGQAGEGVSHGNGTGTGLGTTPPAPARKIDLRPIAQDWVHRVGAAINARASRDYPRSALRAHLQGNVVLAVEVDIHGRLSMVAIKQSSGHAQLDEAALAAARALGELPAPPEALHGQLRPIRVPINYRVQ